MPPASSNDSTSSSASPGSKCAGVTQVRYRRGSCTRSCVVFFCTPVRFGRALNQIEASFYDRMERVGGFGGVGDQMNGYFVETGNPGYFNEDLARYRALSPPDIQAAARSFLPLDRRVELIVEPAK